MTVPRLTLRKCPEQEYAYLATLVAKQVISGARQVPHHRPTLQMLGLTVTVKGVSVYSTSSLRSPGDIGPSVQSELHRR